VTDHGLEGLNWRPVGLKDEGGREESHHRDTEVTEKREEREEFHHKDTKTQRITKIWKTAACRFPAFLHLSKSASSVNKPLLFLLS